eukprot:CAMPEP_0197295694 /NCGR_PEP_ID=MMETSP0890-20130614/36247_1 /TAXON_ID=44058 ORGANISM="Aureoumbra lagunensis, Strain CCMP1510" /NCGR_SAMPLE_ID=MMETSP0890 /ASSEMBLY_ACC=CAM_ASM_000533 /LENGTH=716 /DNA_ID=CAMNT_0042771811 /DNA_START=60 /DNA_END=2210 /DNA_ORIENTATION=-
MTLSSSSSSARKETTGAIIVHKSAPSRFGKPTNERALGGWASLTSRGAARQLLVESYRVSHILVATRNLGEELKKRIEQGNEDNLFEMYAKSISLCPSGREGGGLGWLQKTKSSQEDFPIISELFHLSPPLRQGDLALIETHLGIHLVRCDDLIVQGRSLSIVNRGKRDEEEKRRNGSYYLTTMGCQMNAADSERIEGSLQAMGIEKNQDAKEAKIIILNTCSIRDKAEQKVYSHLGPYVNRKKKGEDLTIIVAGCVAQQEGERLIRRIPEIDIVMGPQYAGRASDLIERAIEYGEQIVATDAVIISEDILKPRRTSRVTAWVNIIYGCNERCTYCVVPATRGIEQSRQPQSIISEILELQNNGFKEVTLLGQNVDAYGRDLRQKVSFYQLLEQCAHAIRKNSKNSSSPQFRIRFVTSHPRYMSDRVIDTIAENDDILMPVFHIPAQSGDDYMLKLMGRGYNIEKYLRIIENIKAKIPDATITSDFIVGCPGETDDAFQNTLDLMNQVIFDSAMLSAYSPRPGTPMARYDGASLAFDFLLDNIQNLPPTDLLRRRLYAKNYKQKNSLDILEEEIQRKFKIKAKNSPNELSELNIARDTARRAIHAARTDPLFAFDELAQIGPAQISDDIKEQRLQEINELQRIHSLERSQRYLGRIEEVLVDQRNPKRPKQIVGRTRGNKLVFFIGDPKLIGQFVNVRITQARAFSLEGELIEVLG